VLQKVGRLFVDKMIGVARTFPESVGLGRDRQRRYEVRRKNRNE